MRRPQTVYEPNIEPKNHIYNQQWQNSGNFSSISSISSNSSSGGGAASRHVNSFKSTSSSVPQSIYYVKGVGEGGGC